MFYALALVCDEFFVPSLDVISEKVREVRTRLHKAVIHLDMEHTSFYLILNLCSLAATCAGAAILFFRSSQFCVLLLLS